MMKCPENTIESPWYTNGFVWLIIALPVSAIVAGFYTLYLAIVSYDGLVADDYYKEGLAINKRIEKQQNAEQLGLDAELQVNTDSKLLLVNLSSSTGFEYPETLSVTMSHTTRQGHDQELQVNYLGNIHYRGDMEALIPGSWIVSMQSDNWRVNKVITLR